MRWFASASAACAHSACVMKVPVMPCAAWERFRLLLDELRASPIAIETAAANAQHYEVPARFFELCLGKRAEVFRLLLRARRRDAWTRPRRPCSRCTASAHELADGQRILELGCGWGSLTLWMAERFPNARITGVSNSHGSAPAIWPRAAARGLANVEILTCDVNQLVLDAPLRPRGVGGDVSSTCATTRTCSSASPAGWKPDARLFVHIFCHRELMYPFDTRGRDNWMGRYFFAPAA